MVGTIRLSMDDRANFGSPGPKLARFFLFGFKPLKNLEPQMARSSVEKALSLLLRR